jgi:hypothetical protein
VTLNIFGRKFSVDFPTREGWSTEFVDLIFFYGLSIRNIAILACLEYFILEGIVNRAASIYSGSRAALLDLKSYAVSSRVVLPCRDSLQELALSNRVQLVWVPRHCSIHGKEEADALARSGSSSAFLGPEPCLRVSSGKSGSGYLNHTAPHGV